jgi:hypothetical protein
VIDFLLDWARIGLGVAFGIIVAVAALLVAYFVGGGLAVLFVQMARWVWRW